MDPFSQGLLGAVVAQSAVGGRGMRRVTLAGLAGGLLPDADVVLEPLADPALPWELHRHFTHGFAMAPVMGLLAALPLLLVPSFRRIPARVLLAGIVGALTHAPLDLCTSYGTKVWWPFALTNDTLDLFPIIDPLFTLVLGVCVFLAVLRRSRVPAVVGVAFLAAYTGFALMQRDAAREAQRELLAARGETAVRARVMPLPASLFAWRSLYEVDGVMVADILRPSPFGPTTMVEGDRLPLLDEEEVVPHATDEARVRDVYRRFAVFADHWTAWDPHAAALGETAIGDMRFSLDPAFRPPWRLRLGEGRGEPAVSWDMGNFADRDMQGLLQVILGTAPALRAIEGAKR